MLQLLNQDKKFIEKINECRVRIRDLKDKIKLSIENASLTTLKNFTACHPNQSISNPPSLKIRKRLPGHFGKIHALHWGSDNDIVSASQDGKLLVWNISTSNKKIAIPLRNSWVMTCAYSPQSKFLASGGLDNLCTIFNIQSSVGWEDKQPYCELKKHEGYLSDCIFIDDYQIITASGDGTIIHWDLEKQIPLKQFSEHNGDIQSISILKERNLIVSGGIDAKAKIWDWRTGECVASFGGHNSDINSVRWFPDGNAFGSGSDDTTCRLFDLRAHSQLNKYENEEILSTVTKIDFSRSGSYLFAGYDGDPTCLGWNALNAEIEIKLKHPKRCTCIQISPVGFSLATGCWDKILRIWG